MSAKPESMLRTLWVALVVSLVSSIFVAGAVVILKPIQAENKVLDRQRSLLAMVGLADEARSARQVRELFQTRITTRIVDLNTGLYVEDVDATTFDVQAAARNPETSLQIPAGQDIAQIRRRENLARVYLLKNDQDQLEGVVLPIRGAGVWSTLYGFIALKADLNTVMGLGFYQHAETPGLGGEIDNPRWRAQWVGKQLFDAGGKLAIQIVPGPVDPASPLAIHQVDAVAGATLTSNGVDRLLQFWLGEQGFAPYLAQLRQQGVQ